MTSVPHDTPYYHVPGMLLVLQEFGVKFGPSLEGMMKHPLTDKVDMEFSMNSCDR